jgi:hypothetical protein
MQNSGLLHLKVRTRPGFRKTGSESILQIYGKPICGSPQLCTINLRPISSLISNARLQFRQQLKLSRNRRSFFTFPRALVEVMSSVKTMN